MKNALATADDLANEKTGARTRGIVEGMIHAVLLLCALVSVFTTIGIVVILLMESLRFFEDVSVTRFVTETKWSPLIKPHHYGILPLFCGTLMVAVGSALIAIPIGLGTAVYLSEYARPAVRDAIKPLLEILGGIPSVVYGYVAVIVVTPALRRASWLPDVEVFNAASACIVVGIMILPMVVSLSEDVLRAVPRSLREAAYALGATKFDVTVRVVIPAALSGIVASFLLAISRAIGETMAVTLAAGQSPNLTLNPFESIQTMTSYIVSVSQGDTPTDSPGYRAIFAVGLTLFISTMVMNLLSQWILSRMREKYE